MAMAITRSVGLFPSSIVNRSLSRNQSSSATVFPNTTANKSLSRSQIRSAGKFQSSSAGKSQRKHQSRSQSNNVRMFPSSNAGKFQLRCLVKWHRKYLGRCAALEEGDMGAIKEMASDKVMME